MKPANRSHRGEAWRLILLVATCIAVAARGGLGAAESPPNFIVIFADDLGYGDLGCFGHPTIRTPHLDRMAAEGMRLTQFYSADSVCSPSRAALLTGRLPIRLGMYGDQRRVLFPDSALGLDPEELTLAEILRAQGYATACVGKWHLGHRPEYLPTRQGFDSYFGIPYSNDMGGESGNKRSWAPLPLMRDDEVIEEEPDQGQLTRRYTEEAIAFIRRCGKERPFFLYLPHTMVHVPLAASEAFEGKSLRGLYGDATEELDWSTGHILDTLRELGLSESTLVLFTSDNGPWLTRRLAGGSAGLLRSGKGSTWEGGMRVPAICWWPGHVPAGTTGTGLASTLDLLPTCAALAGANLDDERVLDGYDLSTYLTGKSEYSPRREMFFYRGSNLMAVRLGAWKAHFLTQAGYGQARPDAHDPPLLYQLDHDPSEAYEMPSEQGDMLSRITQLVEQHRRGLREVPSRFDDPRQ